MACLGVLLLWLAAAIGLSLYALYWTLAVVTAQFYRMSFLLVVLVLTFLVYPATPRQRDRVTPLDWALVGLAVLALGYPLLDFNQFIYRASDPTPLDLAAGVVTTLLVLEATRRSIGWVLPLTAVGFLAYAVGTLVRPESIRRTVVAGLCGLLALVGPSRIYQGHHWLTDVVASYLLGLGYLIGLTALYRRARARRG